ncbi:MAG: hypothetical protein ACYDEX_12110 [Mobilitalea sp.]
MMHITLEVIYNGKNYQLRKRQRFLEEQMEEPQDVRLPIVSKKPVLRQG